MNENQIQHYFQQIERQIAALKAEKVAFAGNEIAEALEGLQLIYEEMQTQLEAAEVVEDSLLQQNQQIVANYQHYYNLFHSLPIAYLTTDANGLIKDANWAIADLLNVPQPYLLGKPFVLYIAPDERSIFRTKLNQLSQKDEFQSWEIHLAPRNTQPFLVQLNVAITRNYSGSIEELRIGIYNLSQRQRQVSQSTQSLNRQATQTQKTPIPVLPQSLDGLKVLLVDDEMDAREFITAVLESHRIHVTAVATVAEALAAIETVHPNVLVSDIRMPDEDGYTLIRKLREHEAQLGWHLPAAALTAYLSEDREKAISAGFEAYLHKLAQPNELIEMVAQLARQTATRTSDFQND